MRDFVVNYIFQCWVFLRVAVHGIKMGAYSSVHETGSVAVGDTFLFSSHRSTLANTLSTSSNTSSANNNHSRTLLQGDGCCVTHSLPYYRCLLGAGPEERSTQRLLACTKSTHM